MTIHSTIPTLQGTRRAFATALLGASLLALGVLWTAGAPASVAAPTSVTATGVTSGGSLLYIKNYNVWLTSPDLVTQRQLTTDGTASTPYRNPSQSDDGNVIVAVQDRNEQSGGFVRSYIYELNRSGTLLRAPFAPSQYTSRLGGSCTIPVLTSPYGILAEVSPDGTKIAVNPQAAFYDFDCGGTFESEVYVISLAGASVNGAITTGSTENLWAPEWLGSSTRLLMYGGFANADFYYDLGAATAQQWIAAASLGDNALEYPIVAGGRMANTGYSSAGDRVLRLRTTNGAPPAQPTTRCDIATANFGVVPLIPRVAPDGGAAAWVEQDQNVSPAVTNIYLSPIGNIASGDCSSLQRQLLIPGGSDPFWGPAGMTTPPPTTSLSVNDVSVTEGNSGTTAATFKISRSGSTTGTSTVTYATANGTATAGSDYTAVVPTTLTFAAGETAKTVTVAVVGDTAVEPNETFSLVLSSPSGATLADATGIATIVNDDAAPPPTGTAYLSVNDVRVAEGNSGAGAATFTLTRSGDISGSVSVKYSTSSGSAVAGSDFTAVPSSTLTFAAGQTSATVPVSILGDAVPEGDETFSLVLSTPVGATVSDTSGVALIVNDDGVAHLSVTDITVSEGNSGAKAATFTISRTGNAAAAASVKYATSNGTALAGSDYTALPLTAVTFAAGQTTKTVSVAVLGDTTTEPSETLRLLLSSPVGASLADSSGTATITNDDGTPTTGPSTFLSISDVTSYEGASGSAMVTFTITRYGNSAGTSSVNYATSNGTAAAGSDYTAVAPTSVTFSAGQTSKTVSVAVLGDTVYENKETFSVYLSTPVGAVVADTTGYATIVNDDAPVYLSVNDLSASEGNSGTKAVTFTITRSGDTAAAVTVKYATANGTALAGSDYTAVPLTAVTFAAGQTTKTVSVTVAGDTTVEASEYFSLSLSAPVGAALSDGTGRATIVNDD